MGIFLWLCPDRIMTPLSLLFLTKTLILALSINFGGLDFMGWNLALFPYSLGLSTVKIFIGV